MTKNMVIYHHPSLKDAVRYFETEGKALEFCAEWIASSGESSLGARETLTVVFN